VYELPAGLLKEHSAAYVNAFNSELYAKLKLLAAEEEKEKEGSSS
jgi:hypothetical protein